MMWSSSDGNLSAALMFGGDKTALPANARKSLREIIISADLKKGNYSTPKSNDDPNSAWVGHAFFARSGSRILRVGMVELCDGCAEIRYGSGVYALLWANGGLQ